MMAAMRRHHRLAALGALLLCPAAVVGQVGPNVTALLPNVRLNATVAAGDSAYFSYYVSKNTTLRQSFSGAVPFILETEVAEGGGFIRIFGREAAVPEYLGEQGAVDEPGWTVSNVYDNALTQGLIGPPILTPDTSPAHCAGPALVVLPRRPSISRVARLQMWRWCSRRTRPGISRSSAAASHARSTSPSGRPSGCSSLARSDE